MEQPRCYVFRGNATGVAAHIRRPVDLLLPVQAASSLPVNGGLSEAKVGPLKFGKRKPSGRKSFRIDADTYITFDSAATSARGDYVDKERAVAMTFGKVRLDDVPTLTTVSASVQNLAVIGRVVVGNAAMQLQAASVVYGEPPIQTQAALDGVTVDGYPVKITLDVGFFNDNNTMEKLSQAAAGGKYPQCFFDAGTSCRYGFWNPTGAAKVTLVTAMSWADKTHPEATIEGNAIIIPDYGKVYFGEMYVTSGSRRLTMARFQLGSDDGGDASGASGDTNGSQWPPTGP